tara:strand:- start:338 stop:748 length:411 start_codon:yes stop_codon:yes gene_type:complete
MKLTINSFILLTPIIFLCSCGFKSTKIYTNSKGQEIIVNKKDFDCDAFRTEWDNGLEKMFMGGNKDSVFCSGKYNLIDKSGNKRNRVFEGNKCVENKPGKSIRYINKNKIECIIGEDLGLIKRAINSNNYDGAFEN